MRVLDLSSARFRRELASLAPRGTGAYAAVARVLRDLAEAEVLPDPTDLRVALPMSILARPVPGTALMVAYVPGGETVAPIALLRRPAP